MDCTNCDIRKAIARGMDLHWHGKVDCPIARCPMEDEEKEDTTDDQR